MVAVPTITELGGQLHLLAETMEKDTRFNWTAFNPSIIRHDNTTYVTIRSSNYHLQQNGELRLLDYGRVRNKIWVCELTPDYKLTNQRLLDQTQLGMRRGMEDARLYHDEHGNLRMCAIGLEDWIPRARVIQCDIDNELTKITGVHVLPGRDKKSIEKNWAPASGVKTNFDYWHSPGTVYVNGKFKNVNNKCKVPDGLRGSTPFIKHGDELLAIMHTTIKTKGERQYDSKTFTHRAGETREYLHYLVTANHDGEITRVSKPFRFKIKGVEFAAGIAEADSNYLVTYGAGDRIARLAVIPKTVVTTLLGEVQ